MRTPPLALGGAGRGALDIIGIRGGAVRLGEVEERLNVLMFEPAVAFPVGDSGGRGGS